jgi:DNA invertase Pin-like site-specific DNA recombinase
MDVMEEGAMNYFKVNTVRSVMSVPTSTKDKILQLIPEMQRLKDDGHSYSAIAKELKINRGTVSKYVGDDSEF